MTNLECYGAQIEAWWLQADPDGEEFTCVDNSRLAREDRQDELATFEEQSRNGCCGQVEVGFGPSPGGHRYLYGFNHGH